AETSRAAGIPDLLANIPQTALPTAMPPCSTSRYIDKARARRYDGDIVCAATFKQARMPIHAIPLANNTRVRALNARTCPARNVIAANRRVAKTTRRSTESQERKRGSRAAPAKAPKPKEPSSRP